MGYEWMASNYPDMDLIPSNVKDAVDIFGVVGDYAGWGLPPGWVAWLFNIARIYHGVDLYYQLMSSTYYFEDTNYISWFAQLGYKTNNGRYSSNSYLFNIDKVTWIPILYAWWGMSQWLLHHTYVTNIIFYWIFEDATWIYLIYSGTWADAFSPYDELKSIGVRTYDKTTNALSVTSHDLTQAAWYTWTWLEEMSYIPWGVTSFVNPIILPTDYYWVIYSSLYSWATAQLPYVTNV